MISKHNEVTTLPQHFQIGGKLFTPNDDYLLPETTALKIDLPDFCIVILITHGPQRTTNYQLCTSFLSVLWHEDMMTAVSASHILCRWEY
jgi:hypothetical protein